MFERVKKGAKLIVLKNADYYALKVNELQKRRPGYYKMGGIRSLGTNGRFFVHKSPFLEGLPQAQALNWEYQCLYSNFFAFDRNIIAGLTLDIEGSDWIVALGDCKTNDILCALNRVKVGNGQVILSTLNILPNLLSDQLNSVVARKLFMNLIEK